MEDLDRPRVVPGSSSGILRALHAFGFEWDDQVVFQSEHSDRYTAALNSLHERGLTFECSCSRTQLADEERYPGTCRTRLAKLSNIFTATRLRVDPAHIQFCDRIQGRFRQNVAATVGDIVLRRRDQIIAYVLAVVIDDAAAGITHVVRGADLLDNTPRQIYLQRLLGFAVPEYAHVPVLIEPNGSKLAKSARSIGIDTSDAQAQLLHVLSLLGLSPSRQLHGASIRETWAWAIGRWKIAPELHRLTFKLEAKTT